MFPSAFKARHRNQRSRLLRDAGLPHSGSVCNSTAVSAANTPGIFMATRGDRPARLGLHGTHAAVTSPPVTASPFPGISGRIRTRPVPSLPYVFCLLHPPPLAPGLQSLLSGPEDLWLIEMPPVHTVHAEVVTGYKTAVFGWRLSSFWGTWAGQGRPVCKQMVQKCRSGGSFYTLPWLCDFKQVASPL